MLHFMNLRSKSLLPLLFVALAARASGDKQVHVEDASILDTASPISSGLDPSPPKASKSSEIKDEMFHVKKKISSRLTNST